jgi:hypothetical protein
VFNISLLFNNSFFSLIGRNPQKIVLSLKQQDEWEKYFDEYKTECRNFVSQINATDKEIDRLVYGLYGLSEEEVRIIKDKT